MQIEFSLKINESETDIQYAARFPQTENRTAIKMPRSDKAAITHERFYVSVGKKIVTVNEWVFLCCIFPPSFFLFVCFIFLDFCTETCLQNDGLIRRNVHLSLK